MSKCPFLWLLAWSGCSRRGFKINWQTRQIRAVGRCFRPHKGLLRKLSSGCQENTDVPSSFEIPQLCPKQLQKSLFGWNLSYQVSAKVWGSPSWFPKWNDGYFILRNVFSFSGALESEGAFHLRNNIWEAIKSLQIGLPHLGYLIQEKPQALLNFIGSVAKCHFLQKWKFSDFIEVVCGIGHWKEIKAYAKVSSSNFVVCLTWFFRGKLGKWLRLVTQPPTSWRICVHCLFFVCLVFHLFKKEGVAPILRNMFIIRGWINGFHLFF